MDGWIDCLLFLNYFGLFCKELDLSFIVVGFEFVNESSAALVASPDSLHKATSVGDGFKLPLDSEHAPVSLNCNGCLSFFFSLLFSFTFKRT